MEMVALEPYETLYSWVTRTHRMRGTMNLAFTYEALFDHNKVFIHPYLPNRLYKLAKVSGMDVNELLSYHTLYPLFRFFHPIDRSLKTSMMGKYGSTTLIAKIPLAGFALKTQHKYCSLCLAEMKSKKGYPTIDIRHQVPGVQACFKHGCRLSGIDIGSSLLSRLVSPKDCPTVEFCSEKTIAFAQFCSDFIVLRQVGSSSTYDRESYVNLLDRRGYVTKGGRIRQKRLKEALTAFLSDLELERGAKKLLKLKFLGPLLREQTHSHMHPLAHMLFAFWLFDGQAKGFDKTVSAIEQLTIFPNAEIKKQEDEVLKLLKDGHSYRAIKNTTGKSVSFVKRIAQQSGLQSDFDSSMYNNRTRYWINILAQLGRTREGIASHLEVNVGIVDQVISNTPGLTLWRKTLWKQQRIVESARIVREVVIANPDWIRKQISDQVYKDYDYLYRHDKALFESIVPPKTKAPGRQY